MYCKFSQEWQKLQTDWNGFKGTDTQDWVKCYSLSMFFVVLSFSQVYLVKESVEMESYSCSSPTPPLPLLLTHFRYGEHHFRLPPPPPLHSHTPLLLPSALGLERWDASGGAKYCQVNIDMYTHMHMHMHMHRHMHMHPPI